MVVAAWSVELELFEEVRAIVSRLADEALYKHREYSYWVIPRQINECFAMTSSDLF